MDNRTFQYFLNKNFKNSKYLFSEHFLGAVLSDLKFKQI